MSKEEKVEYLTEVKQVLDEREFERFKTVVKELRVQWKGDGTASGLSPTKVSTQDLLSIFKRKRASEVRHLLIKFSRFMPQSQRASFESAVRAKFPTQVAEALAVPIGIDEEALRNPQLPCLICKDPMVDPLISSCGHSACHQCWSRWLRRDPQRSTMPCPSCRRDVSQKDLKRLRVLPEGDRGPAKLPRSQSQSQTNFQSQQSQSQPAPRDDPETTRQGPMPASKRARLALAAATRRQSK